MNPILPLLAGQMLAKAVCLTARLVREYRSCTIVLVTRDVVVADSPEGYVLMDTEYRHASRDDTC